MAPPAASLPRIGIDLGGTKTEAVLMAAAPGSVLLARERLATPDDYAAQLATIVTLVHRMEDAAGQRGLPVGVGHPGAVSPATGLIKNANSQCLNGRALQADLEATLGRPVRRANDADCLAVSEAADGAAAGARNVFAAILGTGVGGGLVVNGALLRGPNALAGEWGHNSLPWPRPEWDEVPGPRHWDGRCGAIESWLSGPGLAADHLRRCGSALTGEAIVRGAEQGDAACRETMDRYHDRLARALAGLINLLDPEVIVLGGGLSRVASLYVEVPRRWGAWVFSDVPPTTRLVPALHGDSSGVRGAAWLWP